MDQSRGFGPLLRAYRRAAGLTLEELAERSGVSVRAIGDMERGASRGPRARTVEALADALGTSADRDALLDVAAVARRRRYASASGMGDPAESPVPLDLPADLVDFTGRTRELATLDELAMSTGRGPLVISGAGGLGKTALAVRAVRMLARRFSDEPLFIDLRGVDAEPLTSDTALVRLLRALGVRTDAIPGPTDERAALYRRLIVQRHGLLVLDNAASEAQVRPLLPSGGSYLAMVTSRRALTGLEHARHVSLGPMTIADATHLLQTMVDGDEQLLRVIARRCGCFPLALRIAGKRLLSRPDWTLDTLADRLADEERRLDRLTAGDLRIRTTFLMSYRQLTAPARRMFRRLALAVGPTVSVATAAVAAQQSYRVAERLLDELVELGLLASAGDRYALHDLIRLYARDRLAGDAGTEQAAAQLRDWMLRTATRAAKTFEVADVPIPDFDFTGPEVAFSGRGEAQEWLEAESSDWLEALHAAAAAGQDEQVLAAAEVLFWFSFQWQSWQSWPDVLESGRDAARRLGDRRREALALNNLSRIQAVCAHRPDAALASALEAGQAADEVGDVRQLAWSARYAASACLQLGDRGAALAHAEAAIRLFAEVEDLGRRLPAHMALAALMIDLGRPKDALPLLRHVLDRIDDPDVVRPVHLRSTTLANQGRAHAVLGDWPVAASLYRAAVADAEHAGLPTQQGEFLLGLAEAVERIGHSDEAIVAREQAYRLFVASGDTVRAGEAWDALRGSTSRAFHPSEHDLSPSMGP